MDGDALDRDADRIAAQRRTPGHRHGPLPVGSGICIPQTRMVAPVAGFGRAGVDLHLAGRNPGRGDRIANAVRRTGAHRRAAGARVRGRHALHQQLPADRKMDHCLRLDHRAVVHLRTVAGNDRLAASRPGMGDALVPRRFDGHHHERIGRSGNAPQPVPTFGGDPEPPVEPERRRGHPQATALRVRRHDLLDAGGLGDQQRDDPAGRSDLLRDKNTCGGVAAGRFAPATAPGAKRDAYLCRRLLFAGISSTITSGMAAARSSPGYSKSPTTSGTTTPGRA